MRDLADALSGMEFALSAQEAPARREERDRLARLVQGVARRSATLQAPLLVVVGGGSGAGKSTLVNTLARRQVSAAGVIRPTTRVATLVSRPQDREWFTDDRVLSDLVRVGPEASSEHGGRRLRLEVSTHLPEGVALLDTPDIDSVATVNRSLADEALDAADVWVWVVTSRNYADEAGMDYLRRARDRQAETVIVVNQVRTGEADEVIADVDRLLSAEGVDPSLRLQIDHGQVLNDQLDDDQNIAELRDCLSRLGGAELRAETRQRALAGLQKALPAELAQLLTAVERELALADQLDQQVRSRYATISAALDEELEDGLTLRSEVLERWRQLVGGSETLMKVQTAANQLTELVRTRLGGTASPDVHEVQVEITDELTRMITRLLERAGREARRDLESSPAGHAVLERRPALRQQRPELHAEVRRMVADWEEHISDLIERVGGPRKVRARWLSTALNAVATSAILVLFAVSGGLTGGEVGIAAGAAAASQWLLTKLMGEHNVKRLLTDIGNDLHARVSALAESERRPFVDAIESVRPPEQAMAILRSHAEADW